MRTSLAVGAALIGLVATVAPASAMTLPGPAPVPAPAPSPAPPTTEVPSPGPARTLSLRRGDGQRIRVGWPVGHRTVAPASTVPVRVDQPRRGARKLTVSLLRISAKGRILGAVQRSGTTRGTISVTIPQGAGRRYSLRLLRGGKRLRQLTIRTPAAPVRAPSAPVPSGPTCVPGVPAGQIELGATSVVRGEPLLFAVLNNGPTCTAPAAVVGLERQDGVSWTAVPMLPIPVPAIYYVVPPGERDRAAVGTMADAQPGTYRVTVRLTAASGLGLPPDPPQTAEIQATFAVTAPPAP